MSKIGHNSGEVTAAELQQFIERIEHQEDEISLAKEGLKDIYAEAKSRGYDTKVIRKLVAYRKRDAADIAEERAVMDLYAKALGMGDIFS